VPTAALAAAGGPAASVTRSRPRCRLRRLRHLCRHHRSRHRHLLRPHLHHQMSADVPVGAPPEGNAKEVTRRRRRVTTTASSNDVL
jgi:hypothetical protein